MRHVRQTVNVFCWSIAITCVTALGGVSEQISFQGRLVDGEGNPVPIGTHVLDFHFYADASGGTLLGTTPDVTVTVAENGVVSTPIDVMPEWLAGTPRYMGITIDDEDDNPSGDELQPRILLTAVPFALRAMNLPSTTVLVVESGEFNSDLHINGSVGINVDSPEARLHVRQNSNTEYAAIIHNSGGNGRGLLVQAASGTGGSDVPLLRVETFENVEHFTVTEGGLTNLRQLNVFGATPPYKVEGPALTVNQPSNTEFSAVIRNGGGNGRGLLVQAASGTGGSEVPLFRVETFNGVEHFTVTEGGLTNLRQLNVFGATPPYAVEGPALTVNQPSNTEFSAVVRNGGGNGRGLLVQAASGTSGSEVPLFRVETFDGDERFTVTEGGTTRVEVLQILGGSDLAEPFEVATSKPGAQRIEPGMVVAIDADGTGQLKISTEPYDTKVAGIISGANGLNPGMVMRAEGNEHADGEHNVALAGRVWCWCNASFGSIEPGDMLTTSSTPGHAMKAVDRDLAFGSVIGKAMTPLSDGQGLVLVLVSLQ